MALHPGGGGNPETKNWLYLSDYTTIPGVGECMSFLSALAAVIPDEINLSELNVSLEEDTIRRVEGTTKDVIYLYYSNTVSNVNYLLKCYINNEKIVFNSFSSDLAKYAPSALVSDLILQVDFTPVATYIQNDNAVAYLTINDINETTGDYAGTDACITRKPATDTTFWGIYSATTDEQAFCAP